MQEDTFKLAPIGQRMESWKIWNIPRGSDQYHWYQSDKKAA